MYVYYSDAQKYYNNNFNEYVFSINVCSQWYTIIELIFELCIVRWCMVCIGKKHSYTTLFHISTIAITVLQAVVCTHITYKCLLKVTPLPFYKTIRQY